ncbi:hypothetical protein JKP88DRAFT_281584 [Tribonema minus]|uniref:Uncharacterized protein n=1 Tax=Tribonema minus TaxID=303371 RepID=A0A835YNU1_9STRA|nr:hypothetical protein JKP88DRAFT_281584 [Tribonema minus]
MATRLVTEAKKQRARRSSAKYYAKLKQPLTAEGQQKLKRLQEQKRESALRRRLVLQRSQGPITRFVELRQTEDAQAGVFALSPLQPGHAFPVAGVGLAWPSVAADAAGVLPAMIWHDTGTELREMVDGSHRTTCDPAAPKLAELHPGWRVGSAIGDFPGDVVDANCVMVRPGQQLQKRAAQAQAVCTDEVVKTVVRLLRQDHKKPVPPSRESPPELLRFDNVVGTSPGLTFPFSLTAPAPRSLAMGGVRVRRLFRGARVVTTPQNLDDSDSAPGSSDSWAYDSDSAPGSWHQSLDDFDSNSVEQ